MKKLITLGKRGIILYLFENNGTCIYLYWPKIQVWWKFAKNVLNQVIAILEQGERNVRL